MDSRINSNVVDSSTPPGDEAHDFDADMRAVAKLNALVSSLSRGLVKHSMSASADFRLPATAGRSAAAVNFKAEDITQALDIFFETILANEDVSDFAQNLILQLRQPIIEMTVVNPAFLLDAHHPARRLIKLIVQRCAQLESEADGKSSFWPKIQKIVTDASRHFDGDERIFLKAYFDISQLTSKT